MTGLIATAETDIDAAPERVWQALVDPDQIRQYMFGSQVVTDWRPGSPIVWKGKYEGRSYEDKGEVLQVEPARRLAGDAFQSARWPAGRAGQLPHPHVRVDRGAGRPISF